MGQAQSDPSWIHKTRIKAEFAVLAQLYTEDELEKVAKRLKDVALNFALDKSKFTKILHLPEAHLESIGTWFEEFSKDRASKMVDGLEFVAAVTCVSRKVPVFAKIRRLFHLFDLDDTNCIRKDEFIIFLKATTTGLHRMVQGLPPSPPVLQLETLAGDFFADIPGALTLSDFLVWLTETHASLHFVSCLTRLRRATWVFGRNERLQLGLHLEPHTQHRPTPLLGLEGYTVAKVATNQSHSLFLTDQGRLFSCGRGFAGILGTGDLDDRPQPVLVEALQHVRLADIAVGVRHSACVSEKGQLFTWGAADMGQLGLADDKGRYPSDPRKWAFDPTTGGLYSYVATPAVVSSLWSSQVKVRRVVCNSFSTCALSEEGRLVTAGDATEGQCGHGQMYKGYRMMHLEPHTARTASMVLDRFTTIRGPEVKDVEFVDVSGGGAHTLALDSHGSVWAWGSGQWGRLGHGDSRTCFEPRCVSVLKAHKCVQVSAGFMHSACVASIFRITITGAAGESGLSAFSILGLPVGPLDVWLEKQQPLTPPNTNIELNAFLSAPLLVVDLPLKDTTDDQFINNELYPASAIKESVLLVDRSLWEGNIPIAHRYE
ncbi:unnamed protein product [Vitrella brassicaformis CCMP3155]|uniref:EF-hand domain-containing protein n=1 Tax=Vitrella brassicaformis (strain CCMP3155) TaxID=1169540 RepID=A0A0G4H6E4_VITBC|nr:unnamed protein product [Vitrella brassicaformis CCMP3155]|eukprot:CEM39184.1 unnamed protein product [Vitrella brassicaformis CCMP3155]